ncbi:MAG: alpha/beta hydrolase [Dehalococcoidia bacterium]
MMDTNTDPIHPPLPPQEYLEKALTWTRDVRSRVRAELDIAFGSHQRQKLDVYLPDSEPSRPVPVLIFWHGGYWMLGHKDTLGFMAPSITGAPALLVVPGYRLAPEAKYPEPVDDCRRALAWVYQNIARYGGDPNRIFVGGHSAGGHLAALVTLQRDQLQRFELPQNIVKACFSVSGVFDVADAPLERREAFLVSDDQADEASPLHNTVGNTVPFFLEIGENDFPNLKAQHPKMAAALREQGGLVEELVRKGHDHFQISLDHGSNDSPWAIKVRRWMTEGPHL